MNLFVAGFRRSVLALVLILVTSLQAHAAREVMGIAFDDQIRLSEQPLLLHGLGVRSKMIIKVYAMALYMPRRADSALALLNQSGPKSVRIVMLRAVSSQQMIDSLIAGVQDNASELELGQLQSRLDALQSMLLRATEVPKGAVVQIDYLPDQGTLVMVGGRVLGKAIAGEDFYRALLKIWLGEHPADQSLKRGLLGES